MERMATDFHSTALQCLSSSASQPGGRLMGLSTASSPRITSPLQMCTRSTTRRCVHVFVHVCMCVCVHVSVHVRVYACAGIYVCGYACVRVHMRVGVSPPAIKKCGLCPAAVMTYALLMYIVPSPDISVPYMHIVY